MLTRTTQPTAVARTWSRATPQLAGALLFAAVLPFGLAPVFQPAVLGDPLFVTSLSACAAATAMGFWLFRNLIAFPGIRASYYVLPVFFSTFGAAFTVLFLARLHYSRPLLVTSFMGAVLWHYLVYFMVQRRQRLRIAVVPFGRVESLAGIATVAWSFLAAPAFPAACSMLAVDFDHDLPPQWQEFLAECAIAGVPVVHYKQLRQELTGQVEMERLSENAFGSLVPDASYVTVKRVLDAAVALVALPLALAPMAIIALLVRLDSPGPAFFRQTRIGYRGRPFRLWKFRTMHVAPDATGDAEARRHAMTGHHDSRVTRCGRWLRRSRLDELPQLFNVLRGEMSWIGPRPEAAVLSRWYETEIPFYRYRHVVRPGVSGWAQVNQGHVAELNDVLKKLSYDFFYISRFGCWIDALIVVRTIKTMLTGFGSR